MVKILIYTLLMGIYKYSKSLGMFKNYLLNFSVCTKKFFIILISSFIISFNANCEQRTIDLADGTKNFIKQEILKQHKTTDLRTITIKILDHKHIENKTCAHSVDYSFPIYSSINQKATVVAECKGKGENVWKIYIPVNIKFYANVISAKKPLPKLHIINNDDVVRRKFNVLHLKDNYYADPKDVVGLALKVPVKQDTVLTSSLLQEVEYGS